MFDLNEVPEQTKAGVVAKDPRIQAVSAKDAIPHSDSSGNAENLRADSPCKSPSSQPPALKDGGDNRIPSQMEPLAPKRPASPSIPLDLALTSCQNASTTPTEVHDNGAVASSSQSQQHLSDEMPKIDLLASTPGVAYQFIGASTGDASTSCTNGNVMDEPGREDKGDGLSLRIFSRQNDVDSQIKSIGKQTAFEGSSHNLSLGGKQTAFEGSSFNLSLGGIFHKHSLLETSDLTTKHLKQSDFHDITLGRFEQIPLASRKSSDLSPFWRGKLRTDDAPVPTPIIAYCLGIMTPDSRLKKLPSSLMWKKVLNAEEFGSILRKGLAEPVTEFKPCLEATAEELKHFNSVVKALSHESRPTRSSSTKFVCPAALVSWGHESLDVELYLISFRSIHKVLEFCKSSRVLGLLEEMDTLDPGSLYGIFCYSSSMLSKEKQATIKHQNSGKGISKASDTSLEATAASTEKGRDLATLSPSIRKHHPSRSEILTKSASMEPIRVSSRDANFRVDYERSNKRYQKQLSSIDKLRESSNKHHSKYNSGIRDSDEDEAGVLKKQREKLNWDHGRHSQSQDWRNDKFKESYQLSKEDRDSSKHRGKEYRSSFYDGERDRIWKSLPTEGEQRRNQDMLRHKEKENLTKDSEDLRSKLRTEKSLTGSRSKLSCMDKASPGRESGKLNRKREREDETVHTLPKCPRDFAVNTSLHSNNLVKDQSTDLKRKLEVEETSKTPTVPSENPVLTKPIEISFSLDEGVPNAERFDGIAGLVRPLDERELKPLQTLRSPDDVLRMISDTSRMSVSEFNLNEMNVSPISLRMPSEKNTTMIMSHSLVAKVKEEEKEDTSLEFLLDVTDKETRTWLMSKQNTVYLQEEYGVHTVITPDLSSCDFELKAESNAGPLRVKISAIFSEPCDPAEEKWFVDQAASIIRSIATQGVFIKCLWYEGPVQIHPGDGAPSVPVIVKKIKGEDGKILERMQDMTGVMIGVVLRKASTIGEAEPVSRPRFIGLRLKCARRKGLLEASKEAEALLESVADHFSKELATHIVTHIVDLQASTSHVSEVPMEDSPSASGIATKELLPNVPVKVESVHEYPGLVKLEEDTGEAKKKTTPEEEPKVSPSLDQSSMASKPLYVSNLPDHITPIKIQNIFENVLKEKLGAVEVDAVTESVVDVEYLPDKYCALVKLANDSLLLASLKLFAEDKSVFQGLNIELGVSPGFKKGKPGSLVKDAILAKSKGENIRKRLGRLYRDSDSDYSHDQSCGENLSNRKDQLLARPRPLFLSELMRNASAQTIKELFEDIITTYIGPALVSTSGRQLVLDVRYVPSRGCAFVDLATMELVEFMLDLHSRRPDAFMNMKMELGRKAVPYPFEDDGERRINMRKLQFGTHSYGNRHSSSSWKKTEKRPFELEDSDKGDELSWLSARMKKQRSDPERTIYADKLPEGASESMIKKIFERVLFQKLTREEVDAFGDHVITEVRHVPTKYCAFVVFATEELTRMVLNLYNQNEDAFESMRLKPHFHSRMEDLYRDDLQEIDDVIHAATSFKERAVTVDNDLGRSRQFDLQDSRGRSAAHRAITASAFREVDRRRSVYVDKIPEDLNESAMTEMFEKVFRHKRHGYDGHMVSQVAYFRDKFDPSKLCAFVEVKTEDATQDLVDLYNANPDAFEGMRVRPGFKYNT